MAQAQAQAQARLGRAGTEAGSSAMLTEHPESNCASIGRLVEIDGDGDVAVLANSKR